MATPFERGPQGPAGPPGRGIPATIGANGNVLTVVGGAEAWAAPSVGGGTPGGSNLQIQFNNAGVFGGVPRNAAGGIPILPSTLVTGDIWYWSGTEFSRLPAGATGSRLEVVAGLPAWVAPSDPSVLVLTHWQRGSYAGSPWAGNASAGTSGSRALTEATNPPAVGAALNGYTPADFNGTTHRLTSATAMTSCISATSGSMAALFFADTAATDAGAGLYYNNPSLITDTVDGFAALEFSTGGLGFGSYNGASFDSARVPCAIGGWHLGMCRWSASKIEVRVDSTDWSTLPRSSTIGSGFLRVGTNQGAAKLFDGRIQESLTSQSRWSDDECYRIKSYINYRYGLAL